MIFRVMTMADYSACNDLWRNTPGMGLNSLDDSAEGIARYLQRNPYTCFVAEEEGQLLGAILAGHDGRRGYLHHAAVALDCRRQGIAAALTDAALAALKEEGIVKVTLVAFSKNEGGNAFWREQEFTLRDDLTYWDKVLIPVVRINT